MKISDFSPEALLFINCYITEDVFDLTFCY